MFGWLVGQLVGWLFGMDRWSGGYYGQNAWLVGWLEWTDGRVDGMDRMDVELGELLSTFNPFKEIFQVSEFRFEPGISQFVILSFDYKINDTAFDEISRILKTQI